MGGVGLTPNAHTVFAFSNCEVFSIAGGPHENTELRFERAVELFTRLREELNRSHVTWVSFDPDESGRVSLIGHVEYIPHSSWTSIAKGLSLGAISQSSPDCSAVVSQVVLAPELQLD